MTSPPGWYPDPQHPGFVRWWDGGQWTTHSQPAAAPQPPPYAAQAPQPGAYGTPASVYGTPAGSYGAPSWVSPSSQWGTTPGVYYATKKRGKGFWWSIGVIGAVIVLAGGGFVAFVVVEAVKDVQAPEHQADHYLSDLTHGDYTAAYDRLCASDTSQVSLARFTASKQAHHPLSFRITGTNTSGFGSDKTANVTFDQTTTDVSESTGSQLSLVEQDGSWYVCHQGDNPADWAPTGSGGQSDSGTGPTLPAAFAQVRGVTRQVLSD